jgi:hypothetical protein
MSHDDDADQIDPRLHALPRPKLAAAADARIQAESRAAFLASSARAMNPAPGRWARLWSRALEPAVVVMVIVVYLIWTTQALAAIERGRVALPSTNDVGSMAAPRAAGNE